MSQDVKSPSSKEVEPIELGSPGYRMTPNGDIIALNQRAQQQFAEAGRVYEMQRRQSGKPQP